MLSLVSPHFCKACYLIIYINEFRNRIIIIIIIVVVVVIIIIIIIIIINIIIMRTIKN